MIKTLWRRSLSRKTFHKPLIKWAEHQRHTERKKEGKGCFHLICSLFFLPFFLFACKSPQNIVTKEKGSTSSSSTQEKLKGAMPVFKQEDFMNRSIYANPQIENKTWGLEAFGEKAKQSSKYSENLLEQNTYFQIQQGSISGSTGCNRFSGRIFQPEPSKPLIGPAVMTRMACSGASGDVEVLFSRLLPYITDLVVKSGKLYVLNAKGQTLMIMKLLEDSETP